VKPHLAPFGPLALQPEHNAIEIKVAEGSKVLVDIIRVLDAASVGIESVAVREPSLDDVFLELTGHAAVEDEEAASA
jgi:ABC-2 type transport system ATP-binding protein